MRDRGSPDDPDDREPRWRGAGQVCCPFGSSFILGPGCWSGGRYHHNLQLSTLSSTTNQLPSLLTLAARGTNGTLDVRYSLTLPAPSDALTRLRVAQTAKARTRVVIDANRAANREGYKTAAQISSMFINEGRWCAGGKYFDCHDSNAARFVGNDGRTWQVQFKTLAPPSFIFKPTRPLGARWLDALHNVLLRAGIRESALLIVSLEVGRRASDAPPPPQGCWVSEAQRLLEGDGVRATTAFNRLLGLPGASVRAVRFDLDGVVVTVALRRRRRICSRCGQVCRASHDTVLSRWRHLDLGG